LCLVSLYSKTGKIPARTWEGHTTKSGPWQKKLL
jgi:hypothetical protein